jgi:hypothetical protein
MPKVYTKSTRANAAPARSEHVEAVTLMRVVCLHQRQQPELALFFAVPNGGDRNPIVAAKMKGEGVRAGVPDYLLPVARQGFHGLAIELKAKGGRASIEQREWLDSLAAQGWRAELCVGWGAAWDVLRDYLAIPA